MKQQHLILGLIIVLAGLGLFFYTQDASTPTDESTSPTDAMEQEDTSMPADGKGSPILFLQAGALEDVSGGEATGMAQAGYSAASNMYLMEAVFENLPEPEGTDFYEGWIVRRGDSMSVLSTGRAEPEGENMYSNVYRAEEDLMDHTFYVLTLEPDDGDPAPAAHILEGVMGPIVQ